MADQMLTGNSLYPIQLNFLKCVTQELIQNPLAKPLLRRTPVSKQYNLETILYRLKRGLYSSGSSCLRHYKAMFQYLHSSCAVIEVKEMARNLEHALEDLLVNYPSCFSPSRIKRNRKSDEKQKLDNSLTLEKKEAESHIHDSGYSTVTNSDSPLDNASKVSGSNSRSTQSHCSMMLLPPINTDNVEPKKSKKNKKKKVDVSPKFLSKPLSGEFMEFSPLSISDHTKVDEVMPLSINTEDVKPKKKNKKKKVDVSPKSLSKPLSGEFSPVSISDHTKVDEMMPLSINTEDVKPKKSKKNKKKKVDVSPKSLSKPLSKEFMEFSPPLSISDLTKVDEDDYLEALTF